MIVLQSLASANCWDSPLQNGEPKPSLGWGERTREPSLSSSLATCHSSLSYAFWPLASGLRLCVSASLREVSSGSVPPATLLAPFHGVAKLHLHCIKNSQPLQVAVSGCRLLNPPPPRGIFWEERKARDVKPLAQSGPGNVAKIKPIKPIFKKTNQINPRL
jgi:hypothetical protein